MRRNAPIARLTPTRQTVVPTLVLLVGFAAGGVAMAGPPAHPPFMPTRDVSVVYDVQPDGVPRPQQITVSFSGGGDLMRIESPDGQGDTILDRDKRLMTIIINPARVYMQVPERDELRSPFLLDDSMKFTPAGSDRIAGADCTRWTITSASGNATACVTADGVVLSESGVDSQGAKGHLTARRLSYGPVAASLFQPPPGYSRVAHPEGPAPFAAGQDGARTGPVTGPGTGPGTGLGAGTQ